MTRIACLLAAFWMLAVAPPGHAQSSWTVSGHLSIGSDDTDRGLSITNGDPGIEGALFLDKSDGLYGGLRLARADDPLGNDLLVEGFVGHRRAIGAYELDISVEVESLHGANSIGYVELRALALRDFGRVIISAGAAYAPDGRWFLRNRDQLYLFSDLDIPVRGAPWLSVNIHGGFEATESAPDAWNWGAGLSANWHALEGFANYEQSGRRSKRGDGRFVGGVRLYF